MLEFFLMSKVKERPKFIIKKIVTGTTTVGFLTGDGNLYMRGRGDQGSLGNGGADVKDKWALVQTDVADVWSRTNSLLLRKKDGRWLFTGGQAPLGNNTTTTLSFTDVTASKFNNFPLSSTVVSLAINDLYIILLDDTGKVWGVGSGTNGEFCEPTTSSKSTLTVLSVPTRTGGVKDVQVDKNTRLSYIIYNDGTVIGGGQSNQGQLGVVKSVNSPPVTVESNVLRFFAGYQSYYAVKQDGVYVRGTPVLGQLGNGNNGASGSTLTTSTLLTSPPGFIPQRIFCNADSPVARAYFNDTWYLTGNLNMSNSGWIGTTPSQVSIFTPNDGGMQLFNAGSILAAEAPASGSCFYAEKDGVIYGCGSGSQIYNLLPGYTDTTSATVRGLKPLTMILG